MVNPPPSVISALNDHQSFLIHAHLNPDPDSIASVLALKSALESIGKQVTAFCEDDIGLQYSYLEGAATIAKMSLKDAISLPHQVYISLDTAKWALASREKPMPDLHSQIVNIDHHPDNQINASASWIDGSLSSTSEMVYYLISALKVTLTPAMATTLIAGLIGDTNTFKNLNTTPRVLRLAADLIDIGAAYYQAILAVNRSYDLSEWLGWRLLLKNLQYSPDKTFVYTTVSLEEFRQADQRIDISSFANNVICSVIGTRFGAILIEKSPGITKGAIRARLADVDVSLIAHQLGGGGHAASSGFLIEKSLPRALDDFFAAVANV